MNKVAATECGESNLRVATSIPYFWIFSRSLDDLAAYRIFTIHEKVQRSWSFLNTRRVGFDTNCKE
jgi:hypothetical protein